MLLKHLDFFASDRANDLETPVKISREDARAFAQSNGKSRDALLSTRQKLDVVTSSTKIGSLLKSMRAWSVR